MVTLRRFVFALCGFHNGIHATVNAAVVIVAFKAWYYQVSYDMACRYIRQSTFHSVAC